MILGFKPQFKPEILNDSKIHTIRPDPTNRWKVGNKIHFATGVRTKNYDNFKMGECVRVTTICIEPKIKRVRTSKVIEWTKKNTGTKFYRGIATELDESQVEALAKNDGFENSDKMFEWFWDNYQDETFVGKLIFWKDTDLY